MLRIAFQIKAGDARQNITFAPLAFPIAINVDRAHGAGPATFPFSLMLDLKNKRITILIGSLIISMIINIYLLISQIRNKNAIDDCKILSGYNYLNDYIGLHIDDLRNGNCYRFKKIKPIKPYMGETYLIYDDSGIKTISQYDVDSFTRIVSKNIKYPDKE